MSDVQSRVYRPDPAKCCEACAFGDGRHAYWCPEKKAMECQRDGEAHRDPLCRACLFGEDNHAEWCNSNECRVEGCRKPAADPEHGYCAEHLMALLTAA